MFIQTFTTPIYAESYDFDEGDPAAKGSRSLQGGPTWARSGVIFYLVDEKGKYVGVHPVAYTTTYEGFVDRLGKPISTKNIRIGARMITLNPDRIYTGAIDLWGPPWGSIQPTQKLTNWSTNPLVLQTYTTKTFQTS